MKIQIASDLHLEFLERQFPHYRIITPAAEADLLVLAGDIHRHTRAIDMFADWPVPVVYVMGNHEAYGVRLDNLQDELRQKSQGTQVHFLEKDQIEIGGVRFLGTTLWTDYALDGDIQVAKYTAQRYLNDHRLIRTSQGTFYPDDALECHQQSKAWLKEALDTPFVGKTVVISHHGPHRNGVHPRYAGDALNAAFNSHLPELVEKANVWVFGHVHDNHDYQVGNCRVLANPRGYVKNRLYAEDVSHLTNWENPDFKPELVVEV